MVGGLPVAQIAGQWAGEDAAQPAQAQTEVVLQGSYPIQPAPVPELEDEVDGPAVDLTDHEQLGLVRKNEHRLVDTARRWDNATEGPAQHQSGRGSLSHGSHKQDAAREHLTSLPLQVRASALRRGSSHRLQPN